MLWSIDDSTSIHEYRTMSQVKRSKLAMNLYELACSIIMDCVNDWISQLIKRFNQDQSTNSNKARKTLEFTILLKKPFKERLNPEESSCSLAHLHQVIDNYLHEKLHQSKHDLLFHRIEAMSQTMPFFTSLVKSDHTIYTTGWSELMQAHRNPILQLIRLDADMEGSQVLDLLSVLNMSPNDYSTFDKLLLQTGVINDETRKFTVQHPSTQHFVQYDLLCYCQDELFDSPCGDYVIIGSIFDALNTGLCPRISHLIKSINVRQSIQEEYRLSLKFFMDSISRTDVFTQVNCIAITDQADVAMSLQRNSLVQREFPLKVNKDDFVEKCLKYRGHHGMTVEEFLEFHKFKKDFYTIRQRHSTSAGSCEAFVYMRCFDIRQVIFAINNRDRKWFDVSHTDNGSARRGFFDRAQNIMYITNTDDDGHELADYTSGRPSAIAKSTVYRERKSKRASTRSIGRIPGENKKTKLRPVAAKIYSKDENPWTSQGYYRMDINHQDPAEDDETENFTTSNTKEHLQLSPRNEIEWNKVVRKIGQDMESAELIQEHAYYQNETEGRKTGTLEDHSLISNLHPATYSEFNSFLEGISSLFPSTGLIFVPSADRMIARNMLEIESINFRNQLLLDCDNRKLLSSEQIQSVSKCIDRIFEALHCEIPKVGTNEIDKRRIALKETVRPVLLNIIDMKENAPSLTEAESHQRIVDMFDKYKTLLSFKIMPKEKAFIQRKLQEFSNYLQKQDIFESFSSMDECDEVEDNISRLYEEGNDLLSTFDVEKKRDHTNSNKNKHECIGILDIPEENRIEKLDSLRIEMEKSLTPLVTTIFALSQMREYISRLYHNLSQDFWQAVHLSSEQKKEVRLAILCSKEWLDNCTISRRAIDIELQAGILRDKICDILQTVEPLCILYNLQGSHRIMPDSIVHRNERDIKPGTDGIDSQLKNSSDSFPEMSIHTLFHVQSKTEQILHLIEEYSPESTTCEERDHMDISRLEIEMLKFKVISSLHCTNNLATHTQTETRPIPENSSYSYQTFDIQPIPILSTEVARSWLLTAVEQCRNLIIQEENMSSMIPRDVLQCILHTLIDIGSRYSDTHPLLLPRYTSQQLHQERISLYKKIAAIFHEYFKRTWQAKTFEQNGLIMNAIYIFSKLIDEYCRMILNPSSPLGKMMTGEQKKVIKKILIEEHQYVDNISKRDDYHSQAVMHIGTRMSDLQNMVSRIVFSAWQRVILRRYNREINQLLSDQFISQSERNRLALLSKENNDVLNIITPADSLLVERLAQTTHVLCSGILEKRHHIEDIREMAIRTKQVIESPNSIVGELRDLIALEKVSSPMEGALSWINSGSATQEDLCGIKRRRNDLEEAIRMLLDFISPFHTLVKLCEKMLNDNNGVSVLGKVRERRDRAESVLTWITRNLEASDDVFTETLDDVLQWQKNFQLQCEARQREAEEEKETLKLRIHAWRVELENGIENHLIVPMEEHKNLMRAVDHAIAEADDVDMIEKMDSLRQIVDQLDEIGDLFKRTVEARKSLAEIARDINGFKTNQLFQQELHCSEDDNLLAEPKSKNIRNALARFILQDSEFPFSQSETDLLTSLSQDTDLIHRIERSSHHGTGTNNLKVQGSEVSSSAQLKLDQDLSGHKRLLSLFNISEATSNQTSVSNDLDFDIINSNQLIDSLSEATFEWIRMHPSADGETVDRKRHTLEHLLSLIELRQHEVKTNAPKSKNLLTGVMEGILAKNLSTERSDILNNRPRGRRPAPKAPLRLQNKYMENTDIGDSYLDELERDQEDMESEIDQLYTLQIQKKRRPAPIPRPALELLVPYKILLMELEDDDEEEDELTQYENDSDIGDQTYINFQDFEFADDFDELGQQLHELQTQVGQLQRDLDIMNTQGNYEDRDLENMRRDLRLTSDVPRHLQDPSSDIMLAVTEKAIAAMKIAKTVDCDSYVVRLMDAMRTGEEDKSPEQEQEYICHVERVLSELSFYTGHELPGLFTPSARSSSNMHPFIGFERLYMYLEIIERCVSGIEGVDSLDHSNTEDLRKLDLSKAALREFVQLCVGFMTGETHMIANIEIIGQAKPQLLSRVVNAVRIVAKTSIHFSTICDLIANSSALYVAMIILYGAIANVGDGKNKPILDRSVLFYFEWFFRETLEYPRVEFPGFNDYGRKDLSIFQQQFVGAIGVMSMIQQLSRSLDHVASNFHRPNNPEFGGLDLEELTLHYISSMELLKILLLLTSCNVLQPALAKTVSKQRELSSLLPDVITNSLMFLSQETINRKRAGAKETAELCILLCQLAENLHVGLAVEIQDTGLTREQEAHVRYVKRFITVGFLDSMLCLVEAAEYLQPGEHALVLRQVQHTMFFIFQKHAQNKLLPYYYIKLFIMLLIRMLLQCSLSNNELLIQSGRFAAFVTLSNLCSRDDVELHLPVPRKEEARYEKGLAMDALDVDNFVREIVEHFPHRMNMIRDPSDMLQKIDFVPGCMVELFMMVLDGEKQEMFAFLERRMMIEFVSALEECPSEVEALGEHIEIHLKAHRVRVGRVRNQVAIAEKEELVYLRAMNMRRNSNIELQPHIPSRRSSSVTSDVTANDALSSTSSSASNLNMWQHLQKHDLPADGLPKVHARSQSSFSNRLKRVLGTVHRHVNTLWW